MPAKKSVAKKAPATKTPATKSAPVKTAARPATSSGAPFTDGKPTVPIVKT